MVVARCRNGQRCGDGGRMDELYVYRPEWKEARKARPVRIPTWIAVAFWIFLAIGLAICTAAVTMGAWLNGWIGNWGG